MHFNIGQKVVFLREEGQGVIKSINQQGRYVIEDENGFDRIYLGSELAPVFEEEYSIDALDISTIRKENTTERNKKVNKKKNKQKDPSKADNWEIDLHIEKLVPDHSELSNTNILTTQLSSLRQYFEKAKSNSISRIIVIHGVGEGILRYEVRKYLDKIGGVRYYDADFVKYGKGATVVEIDYNY